MEELISEINSSEYISFKRSFFIAEKCSKLLSSGSPLDQQEARRIVIHILNNWEKVCHDTYNFWTDIIEVLGFYPYLAKNKDTLILESSADIIRQQYFLSDYLENTYFHKEQKKLSIKVFSENNIVASAPTSFGKSLLIEEVVASHKFQNIVIIQPTLALLDETRLKMRKYNDFYKIIVRTSQPVSEDKGNLFILTAERVMEYEPLPKIDFLIIDEFYKLSLLRIDDRADTLNNAFLKITNNNNCKFYLLGPNIDGITPGFVEKYNAVFYKSSFSLVDCNVVNLYEQITPTTSDREYDKNKLALLYPLLDSLENEQTLIYCSSPNRARRYARGYLDYLISKGKAPKNDLSLIEWIHKNIAVDWSLARELEYKIAVHDGSLQKHIGASIIRYFNNGLLNCIFCTSTIIEGVNTSAKNVILLDDQKGGRQIDFFDYSNIKGRSGRLMEHYVGTIYNFVKPPKQRQIIIDIPFYEQNPQTISDEILINISPENIEDRTRARYDELYQIKHGLLDIIKKNGVSVNGQMNIYYALERDINVQYNNIAWSQLPNWDKMFYILSLAENSLFDFKEKHGVFSVKQLVRYLDIYRKKKNIMVIVDDIYQGKVKNVKNMTPERKLKYYDDSIEQAFHLYRHWFQFTVPKAFRVVDSLQRFVCTKHGRRPGSYSYFAQQLENDYIQENLSILTEYGVPASAVRQLEKNVPEDIDEDDVIEFIRRNKSTLARNLLRYELEKIDQCI